MGNIWKVINKYREYLPDETKSMLNTFEKIRPDLFKETNVLQESTKGMIGAGVQPITESKLSPIMGSTPESIVNMVSKLKLTGLVEGYENLMNKGYVPEVRDNKNIWTALGEYAAYPFQKVLETLNIFPRAEAAITKQSYKKGIESGEYPKISDFKLSNYFVAAQVKKNMNLLEAMKTLNFGKEGWKQVAKETFEPLLKANSKYAGMGFTQAYEEMYPNTKFTKPINHLPPESWKEGNAYQKLYMKMYENLAPDEYGNWFQRLISGFAGSPADIAGFVSDILFDPLNYISGGLATGSKQGVNIADDLVKQGGKILPKGAEIGLTKTGRQALEAFEKELYPNIIEGIGKGLISPSAVIKGLNATDDIAKQTAINFIKNKGINQFLQEIPDAATTYKYLDLGGLKVFGESVIPGYKFAEKFGKLKNAPIVSDAAKLFNENANVPDELVPFKNWLISAGENERKAFTDAFYSIIKDGKKGDFDKVQKYLWIKADIERATNKLDDLTKRIADVENSKIQTTLFGDETLKPLFKGKNKILNLIENYKSNIDNLSLNQKQLEMAENLSGFWQVVAEQYTSSTGKSLKAYDFYTPIRYIKDEDDILRKTTPIGSIEQPFMQSRKITMAQAEKLGLESKDLVTSSIQRLAEQEKNIFRSRILNEVKQFGSQIPKEGMSVFNKIPELNGWYLPKEYKKVFESTYRMFFADPSLNKLAKIYDKGLGLWKRLALSTTGYDFRNFFTDNVSGLMEYGPKYYNPKYWYDGVEVLKGSKKKIMLNGKLRYADDILKEMKETGEIAQTTMTAIEASYGKARNILNKISPIEAKFKYLSMPRENLGRVIAGLIERDMGSNKIMAALNVKKVFFDYAHSLTPVERNIMKRFIPFYTWLKNNARRQVELLFTRTGRYATIPKTINFIENISDKPEGYDEFQQDYQKDLGTFITPLRQPGLPDWLANLLNVEKTKRAGMPLSFNPNFAFQDWSRLNWRDMFSALSPFIKAPIELGFGKEVYFDSKIPNYTKAPKILDFIFGKLPKETLNNMGMTKDDNGQLLISGKLNHVLKSFIPTYALAARSFPLSDTENTPYQNLSALLGIKFMPYNEEKAKKEYYENYSEEASAAINKYQKANLGEGEKLPSTTQIKSAYKQIFYNALDEKYKETLNTKKLFDLLDMPKGTKQQMNKLLEQYKQEKSKVKDLNLYELEELLMEYGLKPTLEDVVKIIKEKELQ